MKEGREEGKDEGKKDGGKREREVKGKERKE